MPPFEGYLEAITYHCICLIISLTGGQGPTLIHLEMKVKVEGELTVIMQCSSAKLHLTKASAGYQRMTPVVFPQTILQTCRKGHCWVGTVVLLKNWPCSCHLVSILNDYNTPVQ